MEVTLVSLAGEIKWRGIAEPTATRADVCRLALRGSNLPIANLRLLAGHGELHGGTTLQEVATGNALTLQLLVDPGADGILLFPEHATSMSLARARDGALVHALTSEPPDVMRVAPSPNGFHIATITLDGIARIWNTSDDLPSATLSAAWGFAYDAVWHSDQVLLAYAGGQARVWSAAAKACVRVLQAPETMVRAVDPAAVTAHQQASYLDGIDWHAEGHYLLTTHGRIGCVVWSLNAVDPINAIFDWGHYARFTPRGPRALVVNGARTMALWDFATGSLLWSHDLAGRVDSAFVETRFSNGGDLFMMLLYIDVVTLHNVADGGTLGVLAGHTEAIIDAAFSPDGAWIITAAHDGFLRMWHTDTQSCMWMSKRSDDAVIYLEYNASGSFFATMSSAGVLTVWEASGECLPDDEKRSARERRGLLGLPALRWVRGLGRGVSPAAIRFLAPLKGNALV